MTILNQHGYNDPSEERTVPVNVNRFIGAKGPVVQIRVYLRNKTFKRFVDTRIMDLSAIDGVTPADEMNEHLARTLLPANERAAEYVYRICTSDDYGVVQAAADIFRENVWKGGGEKAAYAGMRELVEHFCQVVSWKGAQWPSDPADRAESCRSWRELAQRVRDSAKGAPVDIKFDALKSAEHMEELASIMEGSSHPGHPFYYVRLILGNWRVLRGHRSTYEFLAGLADVCAFPRADECTHRVEFQDVADRLFSRWDAGVDEEQGPEACDEMRQVGMVDGGYVRIPKDFVLVNPEDAASRSDVVVVATKGAEVPHYVYFCDDAAALVKDNALRRGVETRIASMQEGFDRVMSDDACCVGFFRLPDAAECRECPPYGAAVYRLSAGGPLLGQGC